jgi:hypothetical protein
MVRFGNAAIFVALLALCGAGCKATIRVYDSQACSTDPSEDPQLVCSPAYNLVCANTYGVPIPNPTERAKWPDGKRPIYLCRITCNVEDPETNASKDCNMVGDNGQVDICCPNPVIYGKKYDGYTGVCVQRGRCDILREMPVDAGAPTDATDAQAPPNAPPPSGGPGGPPTPAPDAAAPPADSAGPADASAGG